MGTVEYQTGPVSEKILVGDVMLKKHLGQMWDAELQPD